MRDIKPKITNDPGNQGVQRASDTNQLQVPLQKVIEGRLDGLDKTPLVNDEGQEGKMGDIRKLARAIDMATKENTYIDISPDPNNLLLKRRRDLIDIYPDNPEAQTSYEEFKEGIGIQFIPKAKNTNTDVTIRLNQLESKPLVAADGSELKIGTLNPDQIYLAYFKNDKFYLYEYSKGATTPGSRQRKFNGVVSYLVKDIDQETPSLDQINAGYEKTYGELLILKTGEGFSKTNELTYGTSLEFEYHGSRNAQRVDISSKYNKDYFDTGQNTADELYYSSFPYEYDPANSIDLMPTFYYNTNSDPGIKQFGILKFTDDLLGREGQEHTPRAEGSRWYLYVKIDDLPPIPVYHISGHFDDTTQHPPDFFNALPFASLTEGFFYEIEYMEKHKIFKIALKSPNKNTLLINNSQEHYFSIYDDPNTSIIPGPRQYSSYNYYNIFYGRDKYGNFRVPMPINDTKNYNLNYYYDNTMDNVLGSHRQEARCFKLITSNYFVKDIYTAKREYQFLDSNPYTLTNKELVRKIGVEKGTVMLTSPLFDVAGDRFGVNNKNFNFDEDYVYSNDYVYKSNFRYDEDVEQSNISSRPCSKDSGIFVWYARTGGYTISADYDTSKFAVNNHCIMFIPYTGYTCANMAYQTNQNIKFPKVTLSRNDMGINTHVLNPEQRLWNLNKNTYIDDLPVGYSINTYFNIPSTSAAYKSIMFPSYMANKYLPQRYTDDPGSGVPTVLSDELLKTVTNLYLKNNPYYTKNNWYFTYENLLKDYPEAAPFFLEIERNMILKNFPLVSFNIDYDDDGNIIPTAARYKNMFMIDSKPITEYYLSMMGRHLSYGGRNVYGTNEIDEGILLDYNRAIKLYNKGKGFFIEIVWPVLAPIESLAFGEVPEYSPPFFQETQLTYEFEYISK